MSLFTRGTERRSDPPGAALPPPGGLERGVSLRVTPDTAMRHSAVAGCVLTISNLATLDVHAYVKRDGMDTQVANDPPLLRMPSATYLSVRWRREVFDAWLRRGTAFGLVTVTDQFGYPTKIELVSADAITVRPRNGYRSVGVEWVWMVDGKEHTPWPDGNLWIAPGPYTITGSPVGISPIEMGLGAIRLGLAAEEYGGSWFYNGGQPTAVLQSDQKLDQPTADTIKKRFINALKGGGPAVLGAGLRYDAVQVAANESQFLETIQDNVATVCRYFLIPPEEVGGTSGNSMTYANVEARSLALLTKTYGPWLKHFEETITALTPRPQRVRSDVTDLLRLDSKTRTDLDVADLRAGIRSREEIRRTRALGEVEPEDHIVWPPFSSNVAAAPKPALPPAPPSEPAPTEPPAPPAPEEDP